MLPVAPGTFDPGPVDRARARLKLVTIIERPAVDDADVLHRLSLLNRFLPAWIGAAMVIGIVLGRLVPSLNDWLDTVKIGTVSLPIAIGLLVMMYPVLAKVKYGRARRGARDRRAMGLAMLFNWIVGPIVMFALAWLMLPDLPEYRTGLIIVGSGAVHRHGADLERPRRRRPRAGRRARRDRRDHPDRSPTRCSAGSTCEVLPGWLGLETAHLDVTDLGDRQGRAGLPRHPARRRIPHPHDRRADEGDRVVRGAASCPASDPSPSTDCCSPSWSCSRCRATRSPNDPWDVARIALPLLGLLRHHVVRRVLRRATTRIRVRAQRRRSRSLRRATTSSSPSPWRSASSASPRAKRSPGSSAR